jgi:hypothetical protein
MHASFAETALRAVAPVDRPPVESVRVVSDSNPFDSDWAAVERLTPIVFGDAHLRDLLLAARDRSEFCALVAGLAADHGIDLPRERVEGLLSDARRRWVERWV